MTRTLLASSLLLVASCSGAADRPEVQVGTAEQEAPREITVQSPPPDPTPSASPSASASVKAEDGPTSPPIGEPVEHKEKGLIFQAFTTSEGDTAIAQAEVARAFDENASKLSACLSVDSVLKIKLKVSPSGRVADAQVLSAAPDAPRLRDCVAATLRALSFPKLQGKEPVTLVMDVALKKGSS